MTSAVFPFGLRLWPPVPRVSTPAQVRTDPPAPARLQPVFIHDAVTPWLGETWLSARLKADLAQLDQDQN